MALHTIGTTGTTSLVAVTYAPGSTPTAQEMGNFSNLIADDIYAFGSVPVAGTSSGTGASRVNTGAAVGGTATASTSSATLTSVSITTSAPYSTTGTLSAIQPGQYVYGKNIPGGTRVASVSVAGSSITLTNTPLGNGSINFFTIGRNLPGSFSFNGELFIPNRGVLKIFPGDVIAIDPVSGWPVLIASTALTAPGSQWNNYV